MIRSRICIASLAVVVGLLATSSAQALDPKYLPNDTEIIVNLNYRQILNSDFLKSQKAALEQAKVAIENQMPNNKDVEEYLKLAGFKVERDLISVTFAMPASNDPEDATLIVVGDFNNDKFYAAAKKAAAQNADVIKVSKKGTHQIIEITPAGGRRAFVSLVDGKTLVACTTDNGIQAAISRASGKKMTQLGAGVKKLIGRVNDKQSFSALATADALLKLMQNAPQQAKQAEDFVRKMSGMAASVTVAKDVDFELNVGTNTAEDAQKLQQGANLLLFVFRKALEDKAQQDKKLAPVVSIMNSIEASANGKNVVMEGKAEAADLKKLMKSYSPAF